MLHLHFSTDLDEKKKSYQEDEESEDDVGNNPAPDVGNFDANQEDEDVEDDDEHYLKSFKLRR